MSPEESRLLRLAGAILDGDSLDWDHLESGVSDDQSRQLIRDMRALREIAAVHRHDHTGGQVERLDSPTPLPPDPSEKAGGIPAHEQTTLSLYGSSGELERLGPYRILHEIGKGGMGVVYEAEQEKPIRRRVALKLIKWGMDTRETVARFESERQANPAMLATGDPFGDGVVAVWPCAKPENGTILLYTVLVLATEEVEEVVFGLQMRNPPVNPMFTCPAILLCDLPYFSYICVETVPCFVNASTAKACETPTPVESSTWSLVKGLYR